MRNPSPAVTTSHFRATIGTDYSSTGDSAQVSLTAGDLLSAAIAFTPTQVNTTSSMLVTITTANPIPQAGLIIVQFPSTLRWTRELNSNHTLPI